MCFKPYVINPLLPPLAANEQAHPSAACRTTVKMAWDMTAPAMRGNVAKDPEDSACAIPGRERAP